MEARECMQKGIAVQRAVRGDTPNKAQDLLRLHSGGWQTPEQPLQHESCLLCLSPVYWLARHRHSHASHSGKAEKVAGTGQEHGCDRAAMAVESAALTSPHGVSTGVSLVSVE